jgi:mannosyltransferase
MPELSAAAQVGVEASIKPERGVVSKVIGRVRSSPVAPGIVVASGVALVFGLIRVGAPSFWVDESLTAREIQWSYHRSIEGYYWLYYSIEKPWASLAGASELALRLPSVFATMLACGLLVLLANRLFDGRVAVLAGALLAVNPFVVKWSQQARGYTWLLAVSLVAMLLLLRALDRGTRGSWALYGLAFSAVIVWHPPAGLVLVPAHAVLAYQRRGRLVPHGLLAVVVVLALGVPWAAQIAMRSTGEGVAMNWLRFPTPEVTAHTILDVSGAAGLGLLMGIGGLWILNRARRADLAVWLAVWAFMPFVVALLVSVVRPIFLDRYLIVASPAFAVLVAVAVMGVNARLRAILALTLVVATTVGLAHWYSTGSDGNWRGEDWRSAVRTVLERRDEAEAVVVAPWAAHAAAEYYGARPVDVSSADSIWVLVWSETKPRDIESAERRALGFGDHRRIERLQFGRRLSAQLWRRQSP